MLNVLINAYAVSPNWGSEPGVGWNWIVNIAKKCNVFVITESEWENEINAALQKLPQLDNIHFYFNPVSQEVRDMCWNQGDWRFYHHYRLWQQSTLEIARKIIANNHIDVIHQLNMIGFREPGYLWQIKGIPYVWGPIGNMATIPMSYLKGCTAKDRIKLGVKNVISYFQARTGRVSKAIRCADKIITVLDSSAEIIRHRYGINDVTVMPETGLKITEKVNHANKPDKPLKLLWVGRFIPTKKLDIALETISRLKSKECVELHIVGWGSAEEEARYKAIAQSLGIASNCIWHGKIPNSEVLSLMRDSDVFFFTSILEGTPHVVLEAISNNLPVLCFDLCGQGVIVNDKVGWKIPIKSLPEAVNDMVRTLNKIIADRTCIYEKSANCEIRKPELSWENKIDEVIKIYNSLIKS